MKWLGFVFLFSLMHLSSAFCAAPMFHVYIAEKWLEIFGENYGEMEKQSFMIGTLFPDIRHLGVIQRRETHEIGVGVHDIAKTTDPFLKGKRLHAFVDEARTRLVNETNIMNLLDGVPNEHKISFVKYLEDGVLYARNDWSPICEYLETFVPDPDTDYKVPSHSWNEWHAILNDYFSRGPSGLLTHCSASDQELLGVPLDLIKKWAVLLPVLSQESFVHKYVSDLVNEFETILKSGL